jgi:hypothetical protein
METEMTTNPDTTPETAPSAPRYDELKRMVEAMEADFVRFYVHGNKAAGTRVRQAMQELKTLAQTIRTEVQAIKNEGKPAAADDAS